MPFPLYDAPQGNAVRNAKTFFIGIFAGGFGGIVGLGGGIVMVPLLVMFLGMGQHKAHGTSLAALVFTGASGAVAYWMAGAIDLMAAFLLAIPAVVTAGWGARYANNLPEWRLKKYFGYLTLFVAALMLLKPYFPHSLYSAGYWIKGAELFITGGFVGFLSGAMGVGGGGLMVPSMVLLVGMGQHTAQGSSLLAMVPAGISGARTHGRLGNLAYDALWGLVPGVVVGSFAGGRLAAFLPDDMLRVAFAAALVYTGAKYISAKPKS